jgi:hypothetical protein
MSRYDDSVEAGEGRRDGEDKERQDGQEDKRQDGQKNECGMAGTNQLKECV